MIRFNCPRCSTTLEAPDHGAGSKIECPKCQQRLQIPLPPPNKTILAPLASPQRPASPIVPPAPLAVVCPHCRGTISITPDLIGKNVGCPLCHGASVISGNPPVASAAMPAAPAPLQRPPPAAPPVAIP